MIKTVAGCFSWCAYCLNLLNRLCMHIHALASLPFLLSVLSVRCQVGEITKIMKAYINMIVKKRCSVKSVSSYGTNWIR